MNYRNKKILDEAQHHKCQSCGADDETVVAAHSNQVRHGKGMGIKAHDLPAYLCGQCHAWLDQGGASKKLKNELWMVAFKKSLPLYEHLLDSRGRGLANDFIAAG